MKGEMYWFINLHLTVIEMIVENTASPRAKKAI